MLKAVTFFVGALYNLCIKALVCVTELANQDLFSTEHLRPDVFPCLVLKMLKIRYPHKLLCFDRVAEMLTNLLQILQEILEETDYLSIQLQAVLWNRESFGCLVE